MRHRQRQFYWIISRFANSVLKNTVAHGIVLQYLMDTDEMDTDDRDIAPAGNRKSGIEEEQLLCNEAIESGELDVLSDAAWVSLCEKAAARARTSAAKPKS
jgi:hypothetical protein